MVKLYRAFLAGISAFGKIIDEERCRLAYNRAMRSRSRFRRATGTPISHEEHNADYAAWREKWRRNVTAE